MSRLPSPPDPRAAALGVFFVLACLAADAGVGADSRVSDMFGTGTVSETAPPPRLSVPVDSVAPSGTTNEALTVHTVVPGDTLSELAQRYCGDWRKWREIHSANSYQIKDPDLIYPGQQFRIACSPGGAYATGDGQAWSKTSSGGEMLSRAGASAGSDLAGITHMPLPRGSFRVSSGFGPRNCRGCSKNHRGLDMAAPAGTPVGAAGPGVVLQSGESESFGQWVEIRHNDGTITRYAHMLDDSRRVQVGDTVYGGQQIGRVGNTGHSEGNHLHFEVRNPQRVAMNPAPVLGLA